MNSISNSHDQKVIDRILKLSEKPKGEQFNKEELDFLFNNLNRDQYRVKYCLWKQHRFNGKYICFVVDSNHLRWRNTSFFNGVDIIHSRRLNDAEFMWECQNWGCNNRCLTTWNYDNMEEVYEMDQHYNIETPVEFVKEYEKRLKYGFTKEQKAQFLKSIKGT
jgi:hypothetical protein